MSGERKIRADASRNRDRLLEVAKAAFAADGTNVPLEEIARRAAVGIGTLYRHFPTRDALIAAVYRREVEQLGDSADGLLAERPDEALGAWLHVLVDYMGTKRIVLPVLRTSADGEAAYATAGPVISDAIERLSAAAVAAGTMRADVTADDLTRMLWGISTGNEEPGWEVGAHRMVDVIVAGLKP